MTIIIIGFEEGQRSLLKGGGIGEGSENTGRIWMNRKEGAFLVGGSVC